MHNHSGEKRGDTLIEVMFSVGVFGLVAVGSIGIMNRGLYTAQNSLELTMARNEIDAQAEALRFIQAAYTAEKNASTPSGDNYTAVWEKIIQKSGDKSDAPLITDSPNFLTAYDSLSSPDKSCANIDDSRLSSSFAINYRQLKDTPINLSAVLPTDFTTTPTHPRLRFSDDVDSLALSEHSTSTTLTSDGVQGIWVTTFREEQSGEMNGKKLENIEYFDFYIRTCWDRLGGGSPNTISTVIRLYNPDYTPSAT